MNNSQQNNLSNGRSGSGAPDDATAVFSYDEERFTRSTTRISKQQSATTSTAVLNRSKSLNSATTTTSAPEAVQDVIQPYPNKSAASQNSFLKKQNGRPSFIPIRVPNRTTHLRYQAQGPSPSAQQALDSFVLSTSGMHELITFSQLQAELSNANGGKT